MAIVEKDLACIWHPFTQRQNARPPIPIVRGKGSYLYSEEGARYLDGISSWWVNLHGHAHPYIAEKISKQAENLEHVLFADFTHLPAVELGSRLLSLLPGGMSKIFYTDNGSTAVEAALKMAIQYWYNRDPKTKKRKIISFKRSYHGDTFGAMAAAGKNGFNTPFWNHFFAVESIDLPVDIEHSLAQMRAILEEGDAACFIFEPLILGAGGMVIYPAEGLDALLRLCKEYGVLTIADEVMTGFGRTGPLFACEKLEESPDIICLSKGLTGGFLPLGATACKEEIFNAFLGETLEMAFLHGHSYTANPLACTTGLASLDLLEESGCALKRRMIESCHQKFVLKWKEHPRLKRCEVLGTILVLEYWLGNRDQLYYYFLERGILLRPLGNVLYLLPPYCIQEEELENIYTHIAYTLGETWSY